MAAYIFQGSPSRVQMGASLQQDEILGWEVLKPTAEQKHPGTSKMYARDSFPTIKTFSQLLRLPLMVSRLGNGRCSGARGEIRVCGRMRESVSQLCGRSISLCSHKHKRSAFIELTLLSSYSAQITIYHYCVYGL